MKTTYRLGTLGVALILLVVREIRPEGSFSFEDLKRINGSCYNRGSCFSGKRNRLDIPLDWKEVNCFCDNACIEYGDCCLQAKTYDSSRMAENIGRFKCVSIYPLGSYYMRGKCMAGWADEEVEDLCLVASPGSSSSFANRDPFLHTPVTSVSTDVTYENFYCAVCNNESLDDLRTWHAQLTCPEVTEMRESFLKENVRFFNNTWGVHIKNDVGAPVFYSCDIFPVVADTVTQKIRKCADYITTCSPKWVDSNTERLCHSYTTLVYGPPLEKDDESVDNFIGSYSALYNRAYRNYHCALCNFVDPQSLHCYERDFRTAHPISPVSLSVLFDFGPKDSPCQLGQIWDPFSKECRRVVCFGKNQEYRYGSCVTISPDEGDPNSFEPRNVTDLLTNKRNSSHSCDKIFFNETEYTEGDNGTVIISSIRRTYKTSEYETYKDGILVCIPNSYSRLMGWLTLLGLGLSCLCIIVHLIAFLLVPDLRNLSGKNLASMCLALLIAYLCFLVTTFREYGTDGCPALASVMYFSFISSFAWMNVMAFDIWRTLQLATSELRVTAGKQWSKFIAYSLYAWSLPSVSLALVLIIDHAKPSVIPFNYLPKFGEKFCWFGQKNAILVYFAAPLGTIMVMNIFFFVMAVRIVARTAQSTSSLSTAQPHQVQLKLYLRLALLMGLSWISGILAGLFQREYMWYIFILLNAFQGFYIVIAFTFTKKVRRVIADPKSRLFRLSLFERKTTSSSRTGLEGRDSNNSHLSNTSTTNLSCSKSSVPSP